MVDGMVDHCHRDRPVAFAPRITVAVADRVQVQVVVTTVRREGVDDMTSALLVFPVAPVSVLEIT